MECACCAPTSRGHLAPGGGPRQAQDEKGASRGGGGGGMGAASWPRGLTGLVLCVLQGDFRTFLQVRGFLREAASSCSGFWVEA